MFQVGHYSAKTEIGRGAQGTVYSGTNVRTGQKVAIKALSSSQAARVLTECHLIKVVNSAYIVPVLDTIQTEHSLYTVQPLYPISLFSFAARNPAVPEHTLQKWSRQLVKALADLHFYSAAHCGIKASNIILSEDSLEADVAIIDFGAAHFSPSGEFTGFKGVVEHAAPEMLEEDSYGTKVDIFSLGIVLDELAAGQRVTQRLVKGEALTFRADLSEAAKAFVRRCLTFNPQRRPTVFELTTDPFLIGQRVDALLSDLTDESHCLDQDSKTLTFEQLTSFLKETKAHCLLPCDRATVRFVV